ncbi:MAG: glycosyl transferase [Lentisphaerae bacterium]|nr:glycosyl transferase [Lentisphaerota bacterium]
MPDELFVRLQYWCWHGGALRLDPPVDFNEKIQWQKLNYRNPELSVCADKYEVRAFVRARVGDAYLCPLVGVFDTVDAIDIGQLPEAFALKATRASSWNIVCRDKFRLNWSATKKELKRWLEKDFFEYGREWQYRGGVRRIICEQYVDGIAEGSAVEYKLYTFRGETKYIWVDHIVAEGVGKERHYRNIYDAEWKFQADKTVTLPNNPGLVMERPAVLDELSRLAYELAKDFPQCRVDFYVTKSGRVLFGEMTFTSQGGCGIFSPKSFGEEMGSYIDLGDSYK